MATTYDLESLLRSSVIALQPPDILTLRAVPGLTFYSVWPPSSTGRRDWWTSNERLGGDVHDTIC